MAFTLSAKSRKNLEGVHPLLAAVLVRALEISALDFGVSEGVRELSRQRKLFAQGKSTTLNSLHLIQADGYGHAVDVFVLVNGKITWEHKYFRKVVQAIFTAAIEQGVQIEAGCLWRDFIDSPHIQLNARYYGGKA